MSGLYAGAGCGAVELPKKFFINYDEAGNITYEDGFTGDVYEFDYQGRKITDFPMVRILLLEDIRRAAICTMEIAQTPADLVESVKRCISAICDVPSDNVWVHTTHSFGFFHRPGDPVKFEMFNIAVMNAVEAAAYEAAESFQPARMSVGTGECHVSANKNITEPGHPGEGPYYGPGSTLETDTLMTVITLEKACRTVQADSACSEQAAGREYPSNLLCTFISYDMKPSCLCTTGKSVGNRLMNSEVPGVACKVVEAETGAPCLFAMSAAGDQYPRKTAMYYGYDADGNWKVIDIGFEEGIKLVLEQGLEMGADALEIMSSISGSTGKACADTSIHTTATYFSYANKAGDGEVVVPVEFMTIGDIALCGVKQEVDCASGIQLREASPYAHTLMMSFLNGDGKYMPHLKAYDFNEGVGTWETKRSAFAPGAAEEMVRLATDILNRMHAGEAVEALRPGQGDAQAQASTLSTMNLGGREWYILENKDGRKLLLSKYIYEIMPYCKEARPVTWETSDLRAYLNGEFIWKTFSDDEKACILTVRNETRSNGKYGISGGNPTEDRVFLLSAEECELYLGGFGDLMAGRTVLGRGDEKIWWHLRTPGEAADVNACVDQSGMIDYHGMSDSLNIPEGGVRPAMWVKI